MLLNPVGIQKRTVTAILGTALLVFAFFCVGLVVYRQSLMPSRAQQYLTPYAEIIAAAVDAGNKDRALQQILNSFKSNPQILRADVVRPDGTTLATYPAGNQPLEPVSQIRPDGVYLTAGTAELVRSFSAGNSRPGHLYIRMTLAIMKQRERQWLIDLSLGIVLILGSSALLQFVLLRRWVLSPLAQLAAIAASAGKQGDYSRRMPAHDVDELGQLGMNFNALLAAVEHRETALRQLANFQRAILSDAAYAIVSTDQSGCITSFNPAAEKLFGWKAEELIGKATPEMMHVPEKTGRRAGFLSAKPGEAGAPVFEAFAADARRGLQREVEWTFVRKDGTEFPGLLSVTTLRDEQGELFGFLGMARDITEHKQAGESLRESRRLYEDLVSSLPMGVYRVSARVEGDVLEYVSDQFCEVTGLTRETALEDESRVRAIIHPEDRPAFDRANVVAFERLAHFLWEGRATVRGQTRWLHIESHPAQLPGRAPFWTGVIYDVTDRHDVEEAFHHQHSLLEGALQATADGILAVSGEGRINSYNRQFLELWRVPRGILDAHDLAGLAEYILQQLSNPAAMRARVRLFNDKSKADTFDTLEFTDGRVYERFSRPQVVDGRVVGRVWSFRDVTARHWAVASLRESEHKFKTLFESANDAILIMNESVFLDCNQMSEVIYGAPREKIIGESPVNFSPKRQADGQLSEEKAGGKIRAALAGTPQFFEWIHARGDGTLFNAEVSLNRLELRGKLVIQAIVRDITERKVAEAARHDAEQLYRTLVNTSPDGISLLDVAGRMLYSSPKAMELFYGSAEADLAPEQNALDLVSAQDRPRAAELLRGALGEKSPLNARLLMRRLDGHEFVGEINGRLLRDRLGVPWGILIVSRDVTERQRQEDELKSKNTELERFTYTVSHDLKSPLITIKGFAGVLLADAAAGRTARLEEDLKRIVLAADKMSELLNGLLELSRIGRMVNPPAVVSMTEIARDVSELLAGPIEQRQAVVTVQPGLPDAYGDAQRLQEVLQNLVENALKFSAPGQAPEIEIGFKTLGNQTAYFVRDYGRGIDARFQESIFGLFNKLDPHLEGTGIGLALVRRIVEFHGGAIWVESAGLGKGATFYFTLPAHRALSAPPVTNLEI